MTTLLLLVSGFGIGLISGLVGIGGGTMLVPLFIYAFKMDMAKAVGTSLAVIAPVTLVGAVSHHLRGNVDLSSVLWVAAAAALGIFTGGQVIHFFPEVLLKRSFAVFLVIVAAKMWRAGG